MSGLGWNFCSKGERRPESQTAWWLEHLLGMLETQFQVAAGPDLDLSLTCVCQVAVSYSRMGLSTIFCVEAVQICINNWILSVVKRHCLTVLFQWMLNYKKWDCSSRKDWDTYPKIADSLVGGPFTIENGRGETWPWVVHIPCVFSLSQNWEVLVSTQCRIEKAFKLSLFHEIGKLFPAQH